MRILKSGHCYECGFFFYYTEQHNVHQRKLCDHCKWTYHKITLEYPEVQNPYAAK